METKTATITEKAPKTLLILDGYGNTGSLIAALLLQQTDIKLVLAGRSLEKAEGAANRFNSIYTGKRVKGIYADAADTASLKRAFQGMDMVIVAASTAIYTREVALAALETGIDYLDIQYSTKKLAILNSLAEKINIANCCFITDGGFHPGIPAALVRFVAQYFDRMEKAIVGSVIKIDWASLSMVESSMNEFIEELSDYSALFFKEGHWKKAKMMGMVDYITMDFGREFNLQYCVPMFLEEMRCLPEKYPSLQETGFFVGGFNWFVDWIILPIAMVAWKIWPKGSIGLIRRLMVWGLTTFSKPPYGTMLKVEAQGEKESRLHVTDVVIYHEDGYKLTAIPVVACLLQYLC